MTMKSLSMGLLVFVLFAVFLNFSSLAQLQQSGGSSAGSGSNASVGGTSATAPTSATLVGGVYNSSLPTYTTGQMGQLQTDSSGRLLIGAIATGSNTIGAISNTAFGLSTGTNSIGRVYTVPRTACGDTVFSQPLGAVPTSLTVLASSTSCVTTIVLNNTTSGALTVTLTDNQGGAVNHLLAFEIPQKSQLIQPLGGIAFTSGLKWQASGSGLTGAVLAYQ